MSVSSHSHKHFSTTRWSVVMQLAAASSSDAQGALTELTQRYWYPVYAYVRRCGHVPAMAQDITSSFLHHLLQHFRAGNMHEGGRHDGSRLAAQGHFRRYLLERLNTFLAGDWRETVAAEDATELGLPPSDLEQRYLRDNASANSPEQAYQRSFALEVLGRAFKRLRKEARQTGHLAMYEALEPFLGNDPQAGVYEALARQLNSRPLALVVALKRLRQRFRELVGEELADTVTSADDLAAEQQALHAILRHTQT